MARTKRGVVTRSKHKKVFKFVKVKIKKFHISKKKHEGFIPHALNRFI